MKSFPEAPNKIQARIRRYEKALHDEYAQHGMIHDGRGKRYLLGPLYMVKHDLEGALRSFAWFDATFPNDIGEPGQYLCWALALYQHGDHEQATQKLLQVMVMNLYLLPRLLDLDEEPGEMWHDSSEASPEYLQFLPPVLFQLWDDNAKVWAKARYHHHTFTTVRNQYITIQRQLTHEPVGPRRTQLVKDASALLRSLREGVRLSKRSSEA